jgi:hypothetical protein
LPGLSDSPGTVGFDDAKAFELVETAREVWMRGKTNVWRESAGLNEEQLQQLCLIPEKV